MKKFSSNSSGQALLLVLLSMSVVLTIVLSILARSTVDIGVSSRSEESVRAFSAAEAGIEQALVAGALSGTLGDSTFNASVTSFASSVSSFNLPSSLYSGESSVIWLTSHDADGDIVCDGSNPCFTGDTVKVCWGTEGTASDGGTTPALGVSIFYLTTPGDYTTAMIAREATDPNTVRRTSNSFSATDGVVCTIDGKNFAFSKTLDLDSLGIPAGSYSVSGGLMLARISLLYNTDIGHPVGVDVSFVGNSTLPAQGTVINSSGVSGSSTRKVEVIRGFKEVPGVFETTVFDQGGVSK